MPFGSSLTHAARRSRWALALALAGGLVSAAAAQQADGPVKSAMKLLGFATDPPQPEDFVMKSRQATPPDYIPVFQPPPEPARPALKDKDLARLKGDLDSVQRRAEAARAGFPPAAAAAAAEKTQAAKGKTTPAQTNH